MFKRGFGRLLSRAMPSGITASPYRSVRLRRKALLLGAALFAVLAIAEKPWMVLSFVSTKGLANTAVLAVVALLSAIGVHELGGMFLVRRHWYAGKLALILLPVLVVAMVALVAVVDGFLHSTAEVGPFLPTRAHLYQFASMLLLWMALLG